MREIKWNRFACEDYYNHIDYLLKKWSERVAQNFIYEVDEILYLLEQGNVDYQETDLPNVRRCVIREQITLFYRIVDEYHIELLRFWNNYQDDKGIKF
jgi:hypothetical protein